MSASTDRRDSSARRIERDSWMLWAATIVLLLSLALVVPILYVPLREATGVDVQWLADGYLPIVGLVGLTILFALVVTWKQRQLARMREALSREERDREDTQARLSELSSLFQVSATLQLSMRLEVILEIIVRRVVATMRAQQASLMILDPETGELETRVAFGLEAEFSMGAKRRLGEGIAGWVAQRREAVVLGPKAPNEELGRHYKKNRQITSALSVPLALGDRVLGVLNVTRINDPAMFGEEHVAMLRLFGDHVAAVIERAEALERLGNRTRQLEQDNVKLSDLNHMKDVFLSTASHELKTPLTSVIAYAELLDDHDEKLSRDQSREFVGRLRSEAQRLLGLIEDILDLSRLESGKLVLKKNRLSVGELVDGALETSRGMARKHGVELVAKLDDSLPALELDEVKMRQVVVNLLSNAIRFSPRGGKVSVRTIEDAGFVRLEVQDQGPGIEPEQTSQLFELFQQGVPAPGEQRRAGLGIGLHLVRRISELHGGHVGVNSRPGEGSSFWIRLPIAAAGSSPSDVPAAA